MTLTVSLWMLIYGAVAGAFAASVAKGRSRLIKAAVAGAVAVFLLDLARGLL